MPRIPPQLIRSYIFGGHIRARNCLRTAHAHPGTTIPSPHNHRPLHTSHARRLQLENPSGADPEAYVPLRKQLKDELKRRKSTGEHKRAGLESLDDWELTVGIEIHAQLNTANKLFSDAPCALSAAPNSQVAPFDLALPGSQPIFQPATLIPALRAALALNCAIQPTSRFDRKHYFHWDQPAGYQITQYYAPFAKDGHITLYPHDGIAPEDGPSITVGIKQIQMEQDTAKTLSSPDGTHLLDFNRAGAPLIEIITLPHIHHPSTAAALARKIQIVLASVDACVLGMESGGLRADVNVSVRRRGEAGSAPAYGGVSGLGTRTEIKNLSSFKSIRDAIVVERDRQIAVIEAGGTVEGETRGYTIGATETRRLRGKEGEVDYRYMPDPDLAPVVIGADLIAHLRDNLGVLPDAELDILTTRFGLTTKDALSLLALDEGRRIEYFYDVVDALRALEPEGLDADATAEPLGRAAGNWVLHELGGVRGADEGEGEMWGAGGECVVGAGQMARIIWHVERRAVTGKAGKYLLGRIYGMAMEGRGGEVDVDGLIEEEGLWYRAMGEEEYEALARETREERIVEEILAGNEKKRNGKMMYWVGQMMRRGEEGRVDPVEARRWVGKVVEEEEARRKEKTE